MCSLEIGIARGLYRQTLTSTWHFLFTRTKMLSTRKYLNRCERFLVSPGQFCIACKSLFKMRQNLVLLKNKQSMHAKGQPRSSSCSLPNAAPHLMMCPLLPLPLYNFLPWLSLPFHNCPSSFFSRGRRRSNSGGKLANRNQCPPSCCLTAQS